MAHELPSDQNFRRRVLPPVFFEALSRLPMLDQYKNKFTIERLPNAIMTPKFPNARQKPFKASEGAIHSVVPTANKAKCTQAQPEIGRLLVIFQ